MRGTHLDSMNYPFTTLCYDTTEPEERAKERRELCHKVGNELIRCNPTIPGGILWILDQRGAITTAVEAGEGWRNLEPFPSIIIRSINNFCKATGSISGEIEMPEIISSASSLLGLKVGRMSSGGSLIASIVISIMCKSVNSIGSVPSGIPMFPSSFTSILISPSPLISPSLIWHSSKPDLSLAQDELPRFGTANFQINRQTLL